MTTATYEISGMTCVHCVASVSDAIGGLPGVADVSVDLEAGTATVTSQSRIEIDIVRNAVAEAGYELTG